MIIYLLAYDWTTPGLWASTAPGLDRVRLVSGPAERPEWLFRRIQQAIPSPRSLWALRIVAHGNRAGFRTADSRRVTGDYGAWVHLQNVGATFGQLAGCFTPGGLGIELHSCNVASGRWETYGPGQSSDHRGCFAPDSAGMRFVQDIADTTGARVTAGVSDQESTVRGREDWMFEGTYVVVNPRRGASRLTHVHNLAQTCAN